jgi:hypothetical protein
MAPVNALQQLTRLLADGTWVPMATVHFAAMTAALLAGWMAVRAERSALTWFSNRTAAGGSG